MHQTSYDMRISGCSSDLCSSDLMLHLLARLDSDLRIVVDKAAGSVNWLEFSRYTRALFDFVNSDLSAFFFDIRKDCLYCDAKSDLKRRAYRTVLDTLFHALVRSAAAIIPFTAEEAWHSQIGSASCRESACQNV